MANWHYYNENGEKIGPVSATALKELARQGLITKETKVENSNGRTAVAGSVNGLPFAGTKPPEVPQPTETEVYGLTPLSFVSSVNESDFPALTSEGHTLGNYAPFANTAPVSDNVIFKKSPGTACQTAQKPGLWDWLLLDFRFRFFLTPTLLKIIWCMWVVVVELLIVMFILGFIFTMFSSMLPVSTPEPGDMLFGTSPMPRSGGGSISFLLIRLLPIILIPIIAATILLCIRIALESVMIVFRIGEHLKSIDAKT